MIASRRATLPRCIATGLTLLSALGASAAPRTTLLVPLPAEPAPDWGGDDDLEAHGAQRLAALGVTRVYGGGLCTASDPGRFYSHRRDAAGARMAAAIWIRP
mgnify:CR=1 FL=1